MNSLTPNPSPKGEGDLGALTANTNTAPSLFGEGGGGRLVNHKP